ncbi:MAG: ABC transporter permease [Methylobacteriaceae bacterium]|nr:ABC transporter permease [Methylobacteriaceae bacterium]
MVRRYVYLLRSSWPRLLELIYWPAVQLLTWGFLQNFITQSAQADGFAAGKVGLAAGAFIGAMLLWEILFRGQLGFSISFLEEMWSRNMGNLLMSPLRPAEFVLALMTMSVLRLTIGLVPVTGLAWLLFGYDFWSLGFAIPLFFANLIGTSWAVGLVVSGLILRNGMGAESIAWTLLFLMMPLACVYYPVAVLPLWLRPFAWALPPTYVFEGLRAAAFDGALRLDLMAWAAALNVAYFIVATMIFLRLLQSARRAGSLVQMGE